MKLAEGCTWAMDDEDKERVPLQWKLAATNLATQFHRVVCDHYDVVTQKLQIRVFRDKDTVNPNYYDVVRKSGVMYRQEAHRATLWPCYPERDAQLSPPPTVRRVRTRRVHPTGEVREDAFDDTVHSLFVQRTEINEEIRDVELKFLKKPHPDHVVQMKDLRKKLTEIEMFIVVKALAP